MRKKMLIKNERSRKRSKRLQRMLIRHKTMQKIWNAWVRFAASMLREEGYFKSAFWDNIGCVP
jgi:uncharacterized membrane protein YbaN (DUF454 family)